VATFIPVFVGKTEEDETVVIYENAGLPPKQCIKRPDGLIYPIGMGSSVRIEHEKTSDLVQLWVSSDVWTGEAVGHKLAVLTEATIYI
jgi:hypothetical protein